MDIHLVHKSAKGKIMVLGVFTGIGAKNAVAGQSLESYATAIRRQEAGGIGEYQCC